MEKVGDQGELFLQLRGLIRIQQRHPEGNPKRILPASFLAGGTQSADFLQETEDE